MFIFTAARQYDKLDFKKQQTNPVIKCSATVYITSAICVCVCVHMQT